MKDPEENIDIKKRVETLVWISPSAESKENGVQKSSQANGNKTSKSQLRYYNVKSGGVNAKVRDLIIHEKKLRLKNLEKKLEQTPVCIEARTELNATTMNLSKTCNKITDQLRKGTACRSPLKKYPQLEDQDVLWAHQGKFNAVILKPNNKSSREITDAVFFATQDGKYIYLHNRDKVIKAPGNTAKSADIKDE